MAIFYHISTNLFHNGIFKPRIPSDRMENEDITTNRISVCPTIAQCLTAIPNGGGFLDELSNNLRGYFLVYRIDTKKLNIPSKNIFKPKTLYQKDLVRDADYTEEHWITCEFKIEGEDRFIIKLNNWNEEPYDVIPYSIIKIANKKYDGDYIEAYQNLISELIPSSIEVNSINYICETVKRGTEVEIEYIEQDELDYVTSILQKDYKVNILRNDDGTIAFKVLEDCNLKNLFTNHIKFVNI